jgi:hypothetical protein
MELSDIVIICLLLISIIIWMNNTCKECPEVTALPPKIMYVYKPELDLQFNENNFPSKVYPQLFTGPNVYQGGYSDTYKTKSSGSKL